jgi:hypothetical protein
MRSLEINKVLIYYANPLPPQPIYDEWGNETGEMEYKYDTPKPLKINVSPAKGELAIRQFGESEDYDKVMVTHLKNIDITNETVLWVDNLNTSEPHDYIVKKIAKSLNGTSYAIRKVKVR